MNHSTFNVNLAVLLITFITMLSSLKNATADAPANTVTCHDGTIQKISIQSNDPCKNCDTAKRACSNHNGLPSDFWSSLSECRKCKIEIACKMVQRIVEHGRG